MKYVKKILNFYIESSIHVALAVSSFLYLTVIEFDVTVSTPIYWVVFLGTITGYNFIKYAEIAGLQHKSLVPKIKKVQIFSLLVFCFLVYFLVQVPLKELIVFGVLGLITLLYVVPFVHHKNFRTLSGTKVGVVALVWVGVTLVVPLYHSAFTTDIWLAFVQRFFLVLALIVPFEIRDVQEDSVKLRTFPQVFGVKKTKTIGLFLIGIVFLLEGFKDQITNCGIGVFFFVCLLLGIGILRAKTKQSKYFASFWIESIPIVWGVMVYLFCHFLA